jgi:hypothetical protein
MDELVGVSAFSFVAGTVGVVAVCVHPKRKAAASAAAPTGRRNLRRRAPPVSEAPESVLAGSVVSFSYCV